MTGATSRLPAALYRAEQVRELDRRAIEEFGIEGFQLMRRAAAAAFNALLEQWPQSRHLIVFAGTGNNGGDGYVIAGLARDHGLNPEVVQLGDPSSLRGDALLAWQFAEQRGVPISSFDRQAILGNGSYPPEHTVIVDALLGTGLDRPVSGQYAEAIDTINDLPFPVLAVDIPSGLASDTGNVLGTAVQAELTVTFIGLKQGLLTSSGVDVCGRLLFSDLGVPEAVYQGAGAPVPACQRLTLQRLIPLLSPRRRSANKGHFGHTVVIGGDYGYGGAALMAASAALRCGSGLVSVITRSANRSGFLARQPELMVVGSEDPDEYRDRTADLLERATVIVIGPGLGKTSWSRALLGLALRVQQRRQVPMVLDADALNLLAAGLEGEEFSELTGVNWLLTPHPGEAARLLGCDTAEVTADRFAAVRSLQSRWSGAVLLKGAGSLLCFDSGAQARVELCSAGNPGMASGGMGDVLSGLAGGLLAQGFSLQDSLRLAVCLHAEAADLAAAQAGERGLAATDLLGFIPLLVNPARQPE